MSRDARTLAAHYYAGSQRDLPADLAALGSNPQGIVMYSPQLVVLMKPVNSRQPWKWQQLDTPCQQADAWYVHLLAGDLELAISLGKLVPALPLLCFQRGKRSNVIHCHQWEQTLRHSVPRNTTIKPENNNKQH